MEEKSVQPRRKQVTVRLGCNEYDINFHRERALWWRIRRKVSPKVRMILANHEGKEVLFDKLVNDER
jgi:hypothetical protein